MRLSFCMIINTSQEQTFDRVGIILRTPMFIHGQLYVALSRVRVICITAAEENGLAGECGLALMWSSTPGFDKEVNEEEYGCDK
uniref:ATP-dependent DNA helicase PIF1-like n=1 Tax=Ascaris lumbricoides TaxID=6252 RepID=A0A0M3IDC3_ASCLU